MSNDEKDAITFDVIKDTYIGVLKKYTVIEGRARRREFWIFFFCNLILSFIPLVGLLVFIPGITVGVRRLHDTNRTGKLLLLGLIPAPLIGLIWTMGVITGSSRLAMGFSSLVGIAWLGFAILLLVWAAQEGTHGPNDYGPDPKTDQIPAGEKPAIEKPAIEKPVFCGECGAKNEKGTKFCGECGKPIT